jgi:8-oxo-dGTP diphosphatase
VRCAQGHRHWGLHGSAGLLLRALDRRDVVRVLMQHRAEWTHDGGTWGIPGGARDSHETPPQAAVREAGEEAGIAARDVRVRDGFRDDHGGWVYDTVVADAAYPLPVVPNAESAELRWVEESAVAELPLHAGFATTWPRMRARPVTLVVDAANVVGSRPDGWWRDRAGAAARLVASVDTLRGRAVALPGPGGWGVVIEAVVALEGAARDAPDGTWATVVRAAGSGDDAIVTAAEQAHGRTSMRAARGDHPAGGDYPASVDHAAGGGHAAGVVVVTADRGLRARLPAGAAVAGPRWLRDMLEG